MARIDLHNFFKFYDERNPNHIKAVQWLEDNLPVKFLEDNVDWAEIYRGKKSSAGSAPAAPAASAAPSGDVPMMGIKLIKEFEGCHLSAYPDPLLADFQSQSVGVLPEIRMENHSRWAIRLLRQKQMNF